MVSIYAATGFCVFNKLVLTDYELHQNGVDS